MNGERMNDEINDRKRLSRIQSDEISSLMFIDSILLY